MESIFINGNLLKKSTNKDVIATINDVNNLLNKGNSWVKTNLSLSNLDKIEISNSNKYTILFNKPNKVTTVTDVLSSHRETITELSTGISNAVISNSNKYQVLLSNPDNYTEMISILLSSDYGKTFLTSYYDFNGQFNSVSISNNGQYILVSKNNSLLYSSTYGKSNEWKQIDFINSADFVYIEAFRFINSKLSSNGQYSIVITESYSKSVYFSIDYCQSWTLSLDIDKSINNVNHLFISQTGETIAISCDSCIFISNDYGANWRLATVPNNIWLKVMSVNSNALLAMSVDSLWVSDETTYNWRKHLDITNVTSDPDSYIQNGFYSNQTLILHISNTLYYLQETI
jgi:hypothetical protein